MPLLTFITKTYQLTTNSSKGLLLLPWFKALLTILYRYLAAGIRAPIRVSTGQTTLVSTKLTRQFWESIIPLLYRHFLNIILLLSIKIHLTGHYWWIMWIK